MFKRYPIGITTFLILALLATLVPPFEWGTERLRTERERQTIVPITATLEGEKTPYGTAAQRVFPIDQRDFVFGSSWDKIQVGWGWDISKEARNSISTRNALFDSLTARFNRSSICQWMLDKYAGPWAKYRTGLWYLKMSDGTIASIPSSWTSHQVRKFILTYDATKRPPSRTLNVFDSIEAQVNQKGFLWLTNFRNKYPRYSDMDDSALSTHIVSACPPRLNWFEFQNEMENDSTRMRHLLLFSELGFISRDSLNEVSASLAPPRHEYYSPKQYDYIHRDLNLGGLFLDYLIALLIASILEAARYFFTSSTPKTLVKHT